MPLLDRPDGPTVPLGGAEVCGMEGAAAASVGRGRLEERERDGERE